MNCDQAHNLLNEYVDGELADTDREAVERHIEDCAACRNELHALQRTAELVRSLPRVTAPAGMADVVKSRVARAASVRRRAALARWVSVGGWVAAAATLLVVIKLASWTPEPAEPLRAEAHKEDQKVAAASPDGREDAARKTLAQAEPDTEADRRQADDAAPARAVAEKNVAPSGPEMCEAATASALAGEALDEAPPAPGRAFRAEREEGLPEQARREEQSELGVAAHAAEGHVAVKAAAPSAALRGRAERDGAKVELPRPEAWKANIPPFELTYLCKDKASGLVEVRQLVLAAGGTLVEAKAKDKGVVNATRSMGQEKTPAETRREKDDVAEDVILASVPADRLAWLTARLKQAEEPRKAAGGPSENGAGVPAAQAEASGTGEAGRGGNGKPDAIPVRIVLKIRPASGE